MNTPNQPQPKLVKEDGTRIEPTPPTPLAAPATPVTQGDFLAAIQQILAPMIGTLQAQTVANTVTAEAASDAASSAAEKVYNQLSGQWWDVRTYPAQSVFNPTGDKAVPRDEIVGELWWVGFHISKSEHTPEEIACLNQLRPGTYHGGAWKVIDLVPGQTGTRKLSVVFPCKDPDQRASLPAGHTIYHEGDTPPEPLGSWAFDALEGRWARAKTGIEVMCEEMIREHCRAKVAA